MRWRAVTYIRVSTDEEDQQTSLVNQDKDSRQAILENRWIFVRSYTDENRSGTTTKKRDEYNQLFKDLETDAFDIVVVKDQVRLMRNTREWYVFIDKLVQNKKKLYFYLEKKFYSPDDALLTGIRAILAEEYSRTLSKNINNAHRTRQKTGSNIVITSNTWGYDKVDKKVIVNEPEAKMIHRMYELAYYQNYGARTIAKVIEQEGYRNRKGGRISETVIYKILRNPLYKGTAVMNQRHFDFETKQTSWNPESEWIYHEGIVPAIIEEWLWEGVQKKLDERSNKFFGDNKKPHGIKKNSYPYSGKIICGYCGETYYRAIRKQKHSEGVYWCCQTYLSRGRNKINRGIQGSKEKKVTFQGVGCDNIHLRECDIEHVLYLISKKLYTTSQEELMSEVMQIIEQAINKTSDTIYKEQSLVEQKQKISSDREKLVDKYLDGIIAEDIYKAKEAKLVETLQSIELQLYELERQKQLPNDLQERLARLKEEVAEITDKDLSIKNVISHILSMQVFPNEIKIAFDLFPPMTVKINQINYRKREFLLETTP